MLVCGSGHSRTSPSNTPLLPWQQPCSSSRFLLVGVLVQYLLLVSKACGRRDEPSSSSLVVVRGLGSGLHSGDACRDYYSTASLQAV